MNDRTQQCIEGAAGAPLSVEQKKRLVLAASAAYRMQVRTGLWSAADGDLEKFRHANAFDACGVASFRAMQQRHYLPAMLHFRALAGADTRPMQPRLAADDHRRALAKLRQACVETADAFGDPDAAWSYAETLARRIHRNPLATCSTRQVWQVFYTLRNRAAAIRRKGDNLRHAPRPAQTAQEAIPGAFTEPAPTQHRPSETQFAGFRGGCIVLFPSQSSQQPLSGDQVDVQRGIPCNR